MLEPRRLAAVSAARWMAQRLGEPIGQILGHTIRFESRVSGKTRVEAVTEALIRQEMEGRIEFFRRVSWDKREGRIVSALEERLGSSGKQDRPGGP